MEVENKETVLIFWLWIRKAGSESQDLAFMIEKLDKVLLGHLRDEVQDRTHRVIPRTIAIVRWCDSAWNGSLWQLHIPLRIQGHSELFLEVLSSEVIRIVDEEF